MNPTRTTDPRPFLPSWLRWHDWLTALGTWLNSSRWESGYVVLLLGFVLVYQLASPIVLGDTDMWTHLNAGRYFWQNGEAPVRPYFSFNDPERTFVNYYWGFQALIYKVYELSGYQGLVILRALLVFASLLTIWRVIAGFRQPQTAGLAPLVLLALYVILIDGRSEQLRPHLFSYFFIAIFIYVLEHRPRLAFLLPPITVLWANLHGIEFVVAALIGGAYLIEFLLDRRRGVTQQPGRDWRFALAIVACLPALFLNPQGWEIVQAPFASPRDLVQYVNELRPIDLLTLSTVTTRSGELSAQSAFALLTIFALYAGVAALTQRQLRVSHLLLMGGGLLLLTRGTRFIWEWALLALPLLALQAATLRQRPTDSPALPPARVVGLALLLAPAVTLGTRVETSRPYPFNPERLPVGTLEFLRNTGVSGNVLMYPSLGGYAQWILGDRLRIYSSMEMPPFTDWDMYRIASAGRNSDALNRLLAEHPVDFVLVELARPFKAGLLEGTKQFAPVFFDDAATLYAHRHRQAGLVEMHELKAVNPYELMEAKNPLDARLEELARIQTLYPEGNRALHALTRLLVNEKRYAEAEPWADRFLESAPQDPNSHFLKGVVLENTDRCLEAVEYFRRAFPLSSADFHPAVYQHLGSCAYLTRDFAAAYGYFEKGVNIYTRNEAGETLYQYAYSAVIVGDISRARSLLKAILYQTSEKDTHLRERAQGLLAQVDSDTELEGNLLARLARLFQ